MRQVVLDTETTGFTRRGGGRRDVSENHRIIEIGCVEILDGKLTGRSFNAFIKPDRLVDAKAVALHGITDEFLQGKPVFGDVVSTFLDFIGGAEIVIHNAAFDIAFLDKEFSLLPFERRPSCVFHYVDTLDIARQLFPRQNNTLDGLRLRFGIRLDRVRHGALLDAEILARVYLRMIS